MKTENMLEIEKLLSLPRAEFCNANTRIAGATQIQSSGTLSTGKPASKKNGRRNFLLEPFVDLQKASAYVSALPGGNGNSDGSFNNVGNNGNWWSATENDADNAYNRNMNYDKSNVNRNNNNKSNLYSVRCLQDCNGEAGQPVSPIAVRAACLEFLASKTEPHRIGANLPSLVFPRVWTGELAGKELI